MLAVFSTATVLLALVLTARYIEIRSGVERATHVREKLDRGVLRIVALCARALSRIDTFIRHDVVARSLHIVTAVLLYAVRLLERKLTAVVAFFRGSRDERRTTRRAGLTHIERLHRERTVDAPSN